MRDVAAGDDQSKAPVGRVQIDAVHRPSLGSCFNHMGGGDFDRRVGGAGRTHSRDPRGAQRDGWSCRSPSGTADDRASDYRQERKSLERGSLDVSAENDGRAEVDHSADSRDDAGSGTGRARGDR